MGETSVRHVQPIKQRRGRGSRRIEAFSLKLNRRIQLSSRAAFELWLTLESDPAILTFCERPIAIPDTPLRASVYRLLHRGALSAPALHTQPLSLLTEFQQAVP